MRKYHFMNHLRIHKSETRQRIARVVRYTDYRISVPEAHRTARKHGGRQATALVRTPALVDATRSGADNSVQVQQPARLPATDRVDRDGGGARSGACRMPGG